MGDIVITGYGVKAPGIDYKEDFKEVLEKGICKLKILKSIGPNDSHIVAGVVDHDFVMIKERNYKRHSRVSRLAMAASDDAIKMAEVSGKDPSRIAVIMGTAVGSIKEIEEYSVLATDFKKYPIHGVSLVDSHMVSSSVASHLGINGQVFTLTTGCTAGSDAILLGKLLLEQNQTDMCIVGGADASLGQWSTFGFNKLRQIEINKGVGQTGVPFSKKHKGFVMSEGAGVLILEKEENAIRRGATIFGKIEGIHSNNEGSQSLNTNALGNLMLSAFKKAVNGQVPDYVNSQALGLHVNDQIECYVHQHLFGQSVPITSIKGALGHSFGAMGVIQVISALISMEYNFIPPTLFTEGEGFEGLPIVYDTIYRPVNRVAITTHGLGGNNTCLLLNKY
ncbi:beta-ketoacyl-[acyl-carrier-protein] synthase family protein [Siminovitchia fordii]|uniref:3-oxoacyl-[acyl-carrier-protein] synthase 2 n=1 Tax=Siminovitchia fordii TaxID=254759 RepID=A0ABQ4K5M3_9BACI|nr:beta-ketoacyl synthase N-terminal-like domain-containing protein [Siminovitchia fordii]GIN21023.1 3-oxoacyl-[acyl-carrier-protein] synthase 2 [Siminovitchia fordii]